MLFDEDHTIWFWAATALVLGGVGLVNMKPAKTTS
jgi:drug/metabolite transporter (DMT)-like permease